MHWYIRGAASPVAGMQHTCCPCCPASRVTHKAWSKVWFDLMQKDVSWQRGMQSMSHQG